MLISPNWISISIIIFIKSKLYDHKKNYAFLTNNVKIDFAKKTGTIVWNAFPTRPWF